METLLSGLLRGLGVASMVYILMDAKKRGRNRWLWAILTFFFGLLVLGIYLIVTGRKVWGIIFTVLGALELALGILSIIAVRMGYV